MAQMPGRQATSPNWKMTLTLVGVGSVLVTRVLCGAKAAPNSDSRIRFKNSYGSVVKAASSVPREGAMGPFSARDRGTACLQGRFLTSKAQMASSEKHV